MNLEPGVEITQRTIERYLARIQRDQTISQTIFTRVTDTLLRAMEVKVKTQRLDSTHVLSDMTNMGRARMIGVALKRFFNKIDKHDSSLLEAFSGELLKRYRKQSDSQVFGDVTTTEKRQVALQQAAEDLCTVITTYAEVDPIRQWGSYLQLQTIFDQQCEIREEFIKVRKKTGGNVIQNVSDPDATYCGNKGPGYQVQISETFNDQGKPNFITAAKIETAVQSDADAVEPILADLKERDIAPEELLADSGYGSQDNVEHAEQQNVTLVAPVPGGKRFDSEEVGYDQFKLNEANEVVACPEGHARAKSSNYNAKQDYVWAQMDAEQRSSCPLLEHCRVQRNKKTNKPTGRIQFDFKAIARAERSRHEQTEEYRDRYRWRSGIEATNSSLKRMMNLKRLRVRGIGAVQTAILLKLAGWNILRATAQRAFLPNQPEIATT